MKIFKPILFLSLLITCQVFSQIQIGGNLTVGDNMVTTNSSVINNGTVSFGTSSELNLTGSGILSSTSRLAVPNLTMSGTNYQIGGIISVGTNLDLSSGTLSVGGSDRLIIQSGAIVASQNGSYVDGLLYHGGTGNKFYPIGTSDTFTPVTLFDVSGDDNTLVGVQAFSGDVGAINPPVSIKEVSGNWFWEITSEGTFNGSDISLPLLPEDAQLTVEDNIQGIIVQVDDVGSVVSLGRTGGSDGTQIVSADPTSGPFVAIGSKEIVQLLIRNLITPNGDGSNDQLYIENLDLIDGTKKVIFLDRWGTEIGDNIADFSNNDPALNTFFESFQSGNYICVLILEDGRKITQPVTILKDNQ